ncbi:HSPB1-associated protein 1 isoform X2 [Tamandua tetradactyla]|uniref:HSPB1-associated protein 1 isoform X2 n=1 Tax=Tamandua tetradactyla TaxID=48850 RepID=UPI0040545030
MGGDFRGRLVEWLGVLPVRRFESGVLLLALPPRSPSRGSHGCRFGRDHGYRPCSWSWRERRKDISTIMSLKQNSHTRKNGITCSELPEDCTHSSRVTQHVLTHMGRKPYFSNLFGKALNDQSSFNQQKHFHPRTEHVKPFTPEKAKEIIMSLQQPAVFCNMVFDWPARNWTAKHLAELLCGKQIRFRMGMKSTDTVPQFETTCSYIEATLEEFLTWNSDQSSISGPFRDYDHSQFWAYADYKYFIHLFEEKTDVFQDVIWSDFGFPGRTGRESTLWIGSLGAHTPCHLDSYGCNLVFQVQGRKRWHLFPPEDTPFLYPTRIPYEESSVFSKISVVNPDLKRFPQFQKAQRHVVTLSPGQEEDHQARIEEAITRMLVCALKTAEDPDNTKAWLNPTEVEVTSHEINCHYLNGAVSAFFDHYRTSKVVETQTLRINREPMKKEKLSEHNQMQVEQTCNQNLTKRSVKQEAAIPFGPDLVAVIPSSEEASSERGSEFESEGKDFVDRDGEHFGKLHYRKSQQKMDKSENASNSTTVPSETFISTDDLLDCLVNPQVTRIVAQLLIQGRSL